MLEDNNNDMNMLGDPQNVSSPDMALDMNKDESFEGEDEDGGGELDINGEPKNSKRRKMNGSGKGNGAVARRGGARQEPAPAERQLQELISSLTKQIASDKQPAKKDLKDTQKEATPEGSYPSYNNMPMTTVSQQRPSMTTPPFSPYTNSMDMSAGPSQQNQMPGPYLNNMWQEGALSLSSTVTTYLDAYSRYIARHISVHPQVFEPGSALRILSNPNEQRTPLAFQTFAVLANGARVTGHVPASNDFATRARRTLGAVFDQTDTLVAQGLMILSYYMSGEAEADKTMYYLQLARKMCQHLKTRTSDYYMLILMTIGFASPHPEEKLEVFSELKQRLGPLLSSSLDNVSRNFTLTLAIISVQLELELAKLRPEYNADYPVMLQVLERLEKMLASDKCTSYSKLGFRIFLEVIRAQCYCNLGLREMAVECTNAVSELCKDPEFQYVPIGVLGGVAMMATIQLQESRMDLVREHIARMNKMSTTYPFVRLIAKKLSEALQDKVNKAYERIHHERNLETGLKDIPPTGVVPGVPAVSPSPMSTGSPSSPSYPQDHPSPHHGMPTSQPSPQLPPQMPPHGGYPVDHGVDYRGMGSQHMFPPEHDMSRQGRLPSSVGMPSQMPMGEHHSYMKQPMVTDGPAHGMSPYDQHMGGMEHGGMGMGSPAMMPTHRGMHPEHGDYMDQRRMPTHPDRMPTQDRGYPPQPMHTMHHMQQPPMHSQMPPEHDPYSRGSADRSKMWPGDRRMDRGMDHSQIPHQQQVPPHYMPQQSPQQSHSFSQMMQQPPPPSSGQYPPSMTRTGLAHGGQRGPGQMPTQGMYNMPYGNPPPYMQQPAPSGPPQQQGGFGMSRSALGGGMMGGGYSNTGDDVLDLHAPMRFADQNG